MDCADGCFVDRIAGSRAVFRGDLCAIATLTPAFFMKTLLTFLIAAFCLNGAGFAASPQDLFEQMVPPEIVLLHAAEIGLTDAQRHTLRRAAAALEAEMKPWQQKMREETVALVASLSQEKPDEAVVLAQFEKLNKVEVELKRLRLLMTLRMKAELTAEQQAIARKLNAAAGSAPRLGSMAAKLERIKQGIERWKRDGRDVAQVRELWERSLRLSEEGRDTDARAVLDEAQTLLDTPPAATKPQ
jgi:Spy/CpxP family protein refolding chaperone